MFNGSSVTTAPSNFTGSSQVIFSRFNYASHRSIICEVGKYDIFVIPGLTPESSQNQYESSVERDTTSSLSLTLLDAGADERFTDGSQNMGFFLAEL